MNRCVTCKLQRRLRGDGPEPPRSLRGGLEVTQGHTPTWERIQKSWKPAGWIQTHAETINVKSHPVVDAKKPGKCQRLLFVEKVRYYLKWLRVFGLSSVVGNAGWQVGAEIQPSD